jgi:hypothetical protein
LHLHEFPARVVPLREEVREGRPPGEVVRVLDERLLERLGLGRRRPGGRLDVPLTRLLLDELVRLGRAFSAVGNDFVWLWPAVPILP